MSRKNYSVRLNTVFGRWRAKILPPDAGDRDRFGADVGSDVKGRPAGDDRPGRGRPQSGRVGDDQLRDGGCVRYEHGLEVEPVLRIACCVNKQGEAEDVMRET